MSSDYAAIKAIPVDHLFDRRLTKYGVTEHLATSNISDAERHWQQEKTIDRGWDLITAISKDRCLTDGVNFVSVSTRNGYVTYFTRRGLNDPDKILDAVASTFDTEIVSEDDHRFWDFDTEEELVKACQDAAHDHFLSDTSFDDAKRNG